MKNESWSYRIIAGVFSPLATLVQILFLAALCAFPIVMIFIVMHFIVKFW